MTNMLNSADDCARRTSVRSRGGATAAAVIVALAVGSAPARLESPITAIRSPQLVAMVLPLPPAPPVESVRNPLATQPVSGSGQEATPLAATPAASGILGPLISNLIIKPVVEIVSHLPNIPIVQQLVGGGLVIAMFGTAATVVWLAGVIETAYKSVVHFLGPIAGFLHLPAFLPLAGTSVKSNPVAAEVTTGPPRAGHLALPNASSPTGTSPTVTVRHAEHFRQGATPGASAYHASVHRADAHTSRVHNSGHKTR